MSDPDGVGHAFPEEGAGEGAIPSSRAAGGAGPAGAARREVVLVTGISGSGKSVALHALEDAGFFCVDNLPPELLPDFLRLEQQRRDRRIAIAVDVRSADSLPHLLPLLARLRSEGVAIQAIFLDATTVALVRRFSETRRAHPLADRGALVEAIELERQLLAALRDVSTIVDTSNLRPTQLRAWIRELVSAADHRLTLVFESFAYRHGVPLDADYVFDVRALPNPHYVPELRQLTGRDTAVAEFLIAQPDVIEMLEQIDVFLRRWLPAFEADQRSYLTVAIGCTGGQHRSVWFVERLAAAFRESAATFIRHRELDAS
jgi:UPF0042 nucleotide-binding protein